MPPRHPRGSQDRGPHRRDAVRGRPARARGAADGRRQVRVDGRTDGGGRRGLVTVTAADCRSRVAARSGHSGAGPSGRERALMVPPYDAMRQPERLEEARGGARAGTGPGQVVLARGAGGCLPPDLHGNKCMCSAITKGFAHTACAVLSRTRTHTPRFASPTYTHSALLFVPPRWTSVQVKEVVLFHAHLRCVVLCRPGGCRCVHGPPPHGPALIKATHHRFALLTGWTAACRTRRRRRGCWS